MKLKWCVMPPLAFTVATPSTNAANAADEAPPLLRLQVERNMTAVDEFILRSSEASGGELSSGGRLEPIMDYHNALYYGLVGIGNPSQPFRVVFDSGYNQTWVPSFRCQSCQFPLRKWHFYDETESTTYSPPNFPGADQPLEINYSYGSIKGFWAQDKMDFNGVTVPTMTFGSMEHLSGLGPGYYVGTQDGSIGLGLLGKNQEDKTNFLQNLVNLGIIRKRQFSFSLPNATGEKGELVLGGVDHDAYMGILQSTPVIRDTEWQILVREIRLNGANLLSESAVPALVDSGVPTIAGPRRLIEEIFGFLEARTVFGKKVVKCDLEFALTFHINKNEPPLVLDQDDLTQPLPWNYYCMLLLTPVTLQKPNDNLWVLGDAFIRKYYTVFDADNMQIQFGLSSRKRAVSEHAVSSSTSRDVNDRDENPEVIVA